MKSKTIPIRDFVQNDEMFEALKYQTYHLLGIMWNKYINVDYNSKSNSIIFEYE